MSTAVLRPAAATRGGDVTGPAVTTALATATAAATAWAVVAAGWNPGLLVIIAVATVASVEAGLVGASSARRAAAWAVCPLLAILVVVPLTLSAMSADGGEASLLHVAGRYALAVTVGVVSGDSFRFIVGSATGMWLLGWWTAWTAVRERQAVLACLPVWIVLAANVINARHPADSAGPTTVALAASLVLLGRVELGALRQGWRRDRILALPDVGRRQTGAVVAAAVGVLALGVALPPVTSTDNSGRLFHFTVDDFSGRGGARIGGAAGGGGGVRPGAIGFSPTTDPGGPLVDDPHPVLSFTADTDGVVYLRAVDDVEFERGVWSPATGLPRGSSPAGPISRDRNPADGGVARPSLTVHVRVVPAGGGGLDRALFGGEPDALDQPGVAQGTAGQGGFLTVDQVTPVGTTQGSVTTAATVPQATEAQLRSAGPDPAWLGPAGYLSLGNGAEDPQLQALRALAKRWTAGTSNRYDAARAIEAQLRSDPFTYTLNPPTPPSGEWPVHYFLLTSHRGYCQYYASGMATLLRLLGYPTRVVNGYGNGTVDDAASAARATVHRVTTSDAHTWVELYFAGAGWITFEPTPSTQYGAYSPVTRPLPAGAKPTPSAAASAAVPTATPTPAAAVAPTVAGPITGPTLPVALLGAILGLALLGLLIALGVTLLARPPTVAALWRRLTLLGRLLGVRRPPAETDLAWLGRMAAALPADGVSLRHPGGGATSGRRVHDRAAAALLTIGTLSARGRFGPHGITAGEVLQRRRAWRRLLRVVPLLLWRRAVGRSGAASPAGGTIPG